MQNTHRWFDRPFALFEDNLSDAHQLVLLETPLESIHASTSAELPAAFKKIAAAQEKGYWLSFSADYETGYALEPALRNLRDFENAKPLLSADVFEKCTLLKGIEIESFWENTLGALSPFERQACILGFHPQLNSDDHATAVQQILEFIRAGDCYQVNLTFPIHGQTGGHPIALFAQLRATQAVEHGALLFNGHAWVLSRSPELFVKRTAHTLTCRPMKGTAPRSEDVEIDRARSEALRSSKKDLAENLMIVDLIRNDLGRLAPAGGVQVSQLFALESFNTVHQLTSTVTATAVEADLFSILQALFPCGSVTGAPKIRAMQIIHQLELSARGLYCGALGWLEPSGDFSLNVPIRTLLLDFVGNFCLNVGSGIVADSSPAAEYAECLSKADFALRPHSDLKLIETLRCDSGHYPDLKWHLKRLETSAAALGFYCDTPLLSRSLLDFAGTLPQEAYRVRFSMGRSGKHKLEADLQAPITGIQKTAIAPFLLRSSDPRLFHKTSARGFYDEALQDALKNSLFDLIFLNERGELCEGARSTIFLDMGEGPLRTPALLCGLLPGVLRAKMLEEKRAQESVLKLADLRSAQRIWMGNALRGLIEVQLLETPT